ncbi:MAG: endopeptidase La, partial [Nitrospiraceae bacterium]
DEPEEPHQDTVLLELQEKVKNAQMPSHAEQIAMKELNLLQKMGPATAEYTIGITYIDYLVTLPWNRRTDDNLDIERASRILDEDHYGLEKIKERILEYLAVRRLKSGRKPRILVVDDEEIVRRNMSHALKKENCVVDTASDGLEAMERIEKIDYDLIFTDMKMEQIGGMEILKRTKMRCPDTEVVMITGYATVDTAVESIKHGAFHYIAKPFSLDDVRTVARQALEKRSMQKETKGSVLCFSGPPGTGKTSLGRSVARALGRKFSRISLGGVKDEAEIRGHRRTYAGAMPGRIIEEIRRAESYNPLIILDELDKIGADTKGDPAAALLEVLDPEQNAHFTDHYLDVTFDLSNVMFIITANIAENINDVLRDRMEVIEFPGYMEEEKVKIASQFLIPRQIRETGLVNNPPEFSSEAVYKIIQEYTYEAGIRDLNRQIASICRKIARDYVREHEKSERVSVTADSIQKFLGPRRHYFEIAEGRDRAGVTTGLVWTEVGGDIIFVETARMKGKQQLILTGSLGDVMRESAQTALSYIRSNAQAFGIPENFFEHHDIHIHVPAGSIPKDGPSAGTTIALSLISLLSGRKARRDAAITGELTLSGRILPVGGIKPKMLAAKRAKIKTVILPLKNRTEVESLSEDVRKGLDIHFADRIKDIVDIVLAPAEH